MNAAYAERIGAIDYLANVCVVLELTKSLTELYWMNVNDPSFPFVGVIEHTNLDQAATPAGVVSSTSPGISRQQIRCSAPQAITSSGNRCRTCSACFRAWNRNA